MISTFLYNQYRSGQTENELKGTNEPQLMWKLQLSSDPAYGIETMTIMDANRNLYVGCHNGKLYSVNALGEKRFEISNAFFAGLKIRNECKQETHSLGGNCQTFYKLIHFLVSYCFRFSVFFVQCCS